MKYAGTTWTVETERGIELRSHKIRVEVIRGPGEGLITELAGPEVTIGSGKECDLVLGDRTVSRLHLRLRIEHDAIRVIDAGSRNGTTVDGVRVRDAYARPDSAIGLGSSTLRLRMIREVVELPLSQREQFGRLLGRSVAMRRVFAMLERVAMTDTTVLFEGETGTGKELAAAAVHEESGRTGPFVVFDCSAVSASLIESELFGHKRGAFTGAVADRRGFFEVARGGTLFLDEIGELPMELQPKLLRALEARTVTPVGSNTPVPVDVRIVAATNRNLGSEVDRGRFREDLYYRLVVVPVRLPPLRERVDDIPLLVRHFEQQWQTGPRPPAPLSEEAIARFKAHAWPGNVRELRNKVDQTLSLGLAAPALGQPEPGEVSPGSIEVNLDVPLHVGLAHIKEEYVKAYLECALRATKQNISRAAKLAGVGRPFLQRMMKRHGMRKEGEDAA